jgi:hypothetical protein
MITNFDGIVSVNTVSIYRKSLPAKTVDENPMLHSIHMML